MHYSTVFVASIAAFASTSLAAPAPAPDAGLSLNNNTSEVFSKRATGCQYTGNNLCNAADVKNNANFLIGLGTYVISINQGETKQVAITNGCKIYAYGVQTSSSYARDYGYGVQNMYNACVDGPAGSTGPAKFLASGYVGGNGNIELSNCANC